MSERVPGGTAWSAAGSPIAGYRLARQIGRGPVGVVFQALDEQRGQIVALKVIGPPLAADPAFASRLVGQAQAAAAVGEPHILPVFQAGQADQALFIAMPYLPGSDARSTVRREGALPAGRAVPIVAQIASALDAAHAAGLVHGDLKPANILIQALAGQPERAYLSDFGQGRAPAPGPALAGTRQVSEALDCIAPEQIDGEQADGRADQYSLACVAFELLTGAPPFRRDELAAPPPGPQLPPSAASLLPGLPPAVDSVLSTALAVAPADRYASCGAFADALGGAFLPQPSQQAQAEATEATPAARSEPAGPGPDRPPQALPPQASPAVRASEAWLVPHPRSRRRTLQVVLVVVACVVVLAAAGLVTGLFVARGGGVGPPKPTALHIAATSGTKPADGYVWTVYKSVKHSGARIYGSLTNAANAETARLYGQPFPFSRPASPVGSAVTLHPAGQAKMASYSFRVTPAMATRYHVEIFPDRSAKSPLASSAVTTVYVDGGWRLLRKRVRCGRPVCQETVVGEVLLPPTALSTEMAKPVRLYFGLSLTTSGNAPQPATLRLGGGDAQVTVKPVSPGAYEETVTFTFSVGKKGGFNWLWKGCVQDTEAKDGMGLPGPHPCGDQTIPARPGYLGLN